MAFGYCSASSNRDKVRLQLHEVELPMDQEYAEQHSTRGRPRRARIQYTTSFAPRVRRHSLMPTLIHSPGRLILPSQTMRPLPDSTIRRKGRPRERPSTDHHIGRWPGLGRSADRSGES